jgi:hypothetical protein
MPTPHAIANAVFESVAINRIGDGAMTMPIRNDAVYSA